MAQQFPISVLQTVTQHALDACEYEPSSSGRIRSVPDTRTIRYYTTIGLMDRPAAMRGRTALYDTRHVLQLVAIKRLQAKGLKLSEVQERLVGITTRRLKTIASLPATFLDSVADLAEAATDQDSPLGESAELESQSAAATERKFWAQVPASSAQAKSNESHPQVTASYRIRLSSNLEILVESSTKDAGEIDWSRLCDAAAPLIEECKRQGIE